MNQYTMLSSTTSAHEATALGARLTAWHDAMVIHERRVRQGASCHDECPHVEARALWAEALMTFGARAYELVFLRSRAAWGAPSSTIADRPIASAAAGRSGR